MFPHDEFYLIQKVRSKTFQLKPQTNLMVALDERSGTSSSGDLKYLYKMFCQSMQQMLRYFTRENFDLMVALEKKSGDHQNQFDSSSGSHECLFINSWQSIHQLWSYFSLDRSVGQTGGAVPRATLPAGLETLSGPREPSHETLKEACFEKQNTPVRPTLSHAMHRLLLK